MKILYLPLLILLMCFISLDVYAYDIEVTNDQGVTIYYNYIKDNTELEVCYGEESYSGSVVIPEKVIYQNKSYCVTSIGEYAFNGCTGLISVSIPNNLISIGEYAFMNCESLTSISIPNSVVYIGEWAFGSSGLSSITIPNSVTSICGGVFSFCTGLTSITIPNSVTSIGEYAFSNCSSLTSITIPNSVISIGEEAFDCCSNLISVTIGSGVTSIKNNAFAFCHKLEKVIISDISAWCAISFENEDSNPLYHANHLYSDENTEITNLEIPSGVTSIEKQFLNCESFTSITIPSSVTSIGGNAFYGCDNLNSLTICSDMLSIGESAFSCLKGNVFCYTDADKLEWPGKFFPYYSSSVKFHVFDRAAYEAKFPNSGVVFDDNMYTIINGIAYKILSTTDKTVQVVCNEEEYYEGDYIIPSSIISNNETYTVVSIGEEAFYGSDLTSVTIPNSVTSIEDNAFSWCPKLESIIVEEGNSVYDSRNNCNAIIETGTNTLVVGSKNTIIPDNVVSIGQLAFSDCDGLTSIVIPESITSIKKDAFAFCDKLKKVIVPNISAWCAISFENGDSNPLCRARHLYSDENTEITNLEIPSGVTSIGSYAFLNCEGLTSLNIPSGVTSVSNNAFYGCKNLVTMTINSSEISIAENVFMNCGSITDVYCYTESEKMEWAGRFFPSKGFVKFHVFDKAAYVTKFPNAAVSFDDGLRTIVNEGITYKIISTTDKTAQVVAGKEKYEGDIIIPASVVSDNNVTYSVVAIGDNAFSQCSDLISVTIPNSVTSIGERAFYSSGITSITIPNNVCSLGESVFDDCSGLVSVVIPNSVTSISNYAFSRCSSLTSVTIPNSVTSIGENAFYECSSLSSVTIPNSVESIGAGAFNWSGLTSVSIPNSVTSIGEFAFGSCENLEKVIVPDISAWCSIDFENESSNPLCYGHHIYSDEDTEMTKLDIPSGVTSINKYAFYNCESLTSVTIPNSVSSIGNDAFHNCDNMTSLTINSDVISIVQDAFKESSSVTEVYCYTTPENMEWTGWFFPSSYDVKFHVFDKAACEAKFPNAGVEFDERLLVYGGVVYKIISTTDKTAKVIANEEGYKGDIEIAASFDCNNVTYSVVAIDDKAFYDCDELTSVIIPTSVKSIGYQAFLNCNRMTSITIPDGITSIEDGTFASCNSLTSIVIPNSVKSIGNWAFESCGFQSLTIGNNVESIGSYAFTGCSSLVSITISNNITSIAEGTFSNCSNLTSFVMPDNITSIGEQAFYNCSSLTSIVIPNGVTSVESFAFLNCENLTSIEIPSSVIFLGAGAFSGCKNLATISINSSKISISNNSFSSCQNIETITISSSEISFAENVFMSCSSIADVYCYTEPEKVEWQGRFFPSKAFVKFHVFDKAPYETKFPNAGVIFDDGLRTIVSDGITYEIVSTTDKTAKVIAGEEGYKGDIEIAASIISNNVAYSVVAIDKEAFSGCSDLTSVIIPNSVTSIGEWAFYDSGITSITIPNSVTSIGEDAFAACSNLTSVTIPNSVISIGKNAFGYCSGLTFITIPNSVTSISEYAFYGCSGLASIIIPNSVNSIGDYAFNGCSSLTSVIIPNSVTFIGEGVFSGCSGLKTVSFGKGLTTISASAFRECSNLTSVTIPTNVTSIEDYAFSYCENLSAINIESEVLSVGYLPFLHCSSVEDVYCYMASDRLEWQDRFFPHSSVKFHVFDKAAYEAKFPDAVVEFDDDLSKIISNGVTYKIISTTDKTAKVIANEEGYKGDIEIAASIISNNVAYSVVAIDKEAFSGCSDLTSVIIPNSVTSIGEHAFDNCIALESIIVEEGNDVYDSRNNCNAIIETGTNKFLYGCKNTVIPNSVLTIGQSAFSGCSKLTSIDIPNSVTSIEEEAFSSCSDLISVTIGSGVTSIKNNAFAFCHKLEKVIVPDISAWCSIAFGNNDSNPLYHARHLYSDENTEITNLDIPSGVNSISKYAFLNCESLSSVAIPNSVTSIDADAFQGCKNLTTMTINSAEISIAENAFIYCTSITDVICYTEPEKMEWQGRFFPHKNNVLFYVNDKYAYQPKFPNAGVTFCSFSGLCYEVISEIDKTAKVVEDTKKYKGDIEIASSCVIDGVTYSVIEIGNYAFYECGDLTSITIPHSVASIGNSAFKGCGGLVSIKVENGNPKYDSRNDCNAIIETSSNKLILGSKNTVIPNSVTIIGSNAFRGCNGLTSVTIPNSVIFISDHAFEYCSDLSSITIGNSVDYIGTGIFNNCSNLTSIKVESGNLKYDSRDDCNAIIETSSNTLIKGCKGTIIPNSVTVIGNSAFEHNTGLTSMIIPNSVTSIGESAFYICGDLTSVSIPNSVTSIGSAAFCHCSRLTSICLFLISVDIFSLIS